MNTDTIDNVWLADTLVEQLAEWDDLRFSPNPKMQASIDKLLVTLSVWATNRALTEAVHTRMCQLQAAVEGC